MSEAPAEDAFEQRIPVSEPELTEPDEQPQEEEVYPVLQSDEVDPADAVEQNLEVPEDDEDRR